MKGHSPLTFAIIATDVALFSYLDKELCVRLIPCTNTTDFPNMKCLPGGLIHIKENSDEAVHRILKEKANIEKNIICIRQFKTYSRVDRDPRGRVVSIGYVGVIHEKDIHEDDRGMFVPVKQALRLGYDHDEILDDALLELRSLVMTTNIIFKLIPHEFTVMELKEAWETIMCKVADKRNFLKKLKLENALKDTKRKRKDGAHRPASIFIHTDKTLVKKDFF